MALKDEVEDNVDLTLVLGTMLLQFTLSVVMLDFASQKGWSGALPVLALPHGLCPMILSVILGRKIGLFGAIYSTLLGAILFMAVNQITYIACSSLIGFPFAMGVITVSWSAVACLSSRPSFASPRRSPGWSSGFESSPHEAPALGGPGGDSMRRKATRQEG